MQHIAGHYQTVVAGAGPAGVMAALTAAEAGDVLLCDSAALPRAKSCGGMLNEYSQRFLEQYADIPASLCLEPSHVRFRYVDWDRRIRKATELDFLNVDRRAFDEWLLTLLPDRVTVAERLGVEDVHEHDDHVALTLRNSRATSEVTCDNLIGADGARSSVRRAIGVASTSTYVTLQDWVRLDGELEPFFDCIYMRDVGDSYAYSYVVPKGDLAIVGSVYYPRTVRPHEKQDLTLGILRAAFPQLGQTEKREASVALYVRAASDVVPGRGRVLLAGEAGGFMSPTSGEGISYALNSGRLAGSAVAEAGPEAALDAYARATADIRGNVARKLRWLPFMESPTGKYLAGFVPAPLVSRVTKGL